MATATLSKAEQIFKLQRTIMAGNVVSGVARESGPRLIITVGPYRTALGGGGDYAIIRKGFADHFLSALGAAAHFFAIATPLWDDEEDADEIELSELVVVDSITSRWPL